MNTIYFDAHLSDDVRRQNLYSGNLYVLSPSPNSVALCDFARELIEDEFGCPDPANAQNHMPVEEYAAILSRLKPNFIHHPKSKYYLQRILAEHDCSLDETYFDVPRLRSSTSDNYLTTGIAYAWHPHRDTWYSAPQSQINWWLPIYELDNNGIAFHPRYWTEPVPNDSNLYNYYEWNSTYRPSAAQHLKQDSRPLSRPTVSIELDPQIRPVCPPGGIILFSAAQMHSSVPNMSGKTRFSIDFRVVNLSDVEAKRGAPNLDAACTGTSLRDFLCCRDLTRIPEEIIALYNDGTEHQGKLIYDAPPVRL